MTLEEALCACLEGWAARIVTHVILRTMAAKAAWQRVTVKPRTGAHTAHKDTQHREGHIRLCIAVHQAQLRDDLLDLHRCDMWEPGL